MELRPDAMLLTYRLVEKIGEGGMGQVWKALDTTLGREVAVKILPTDLKDDPDRLARFTREAKLLASINHPHIATIHGLEEAEGRRFIVMELVTGSDLARRLAGGPAARGETLDWFAQIAEALEAAHEQGVVHRDLKPANVQINAAAKVKVLDFGLAKSLAPDSTPDDATVTTGGRTQAGIILGTPAYMSPEQTRGAELDKRTDIWSFGCMLFEALSGARPFAGETTSDTLARILQNEPDWERLPADLPPPVRRLLVRCLRKDASVRLRDIGDARIVLHEQRSDSLTAETKTAGGASAAPVTKTGGTRAGWLYPLLALGLGFGLHWALSSIRPAASEPSSSSSIRAEISLGEGRELQYWDTASVAISPDGAHLVFTVEHPDRTTELYLRAMDEDVAESIPGTTGGNDPFFSPDGRWVAYFDYPGKRLMKVPVDGGAPIAVAPALDYSRGGSWNADGTLVFPLAYTSGLYRVSADGGEPVELTQLGEGGKSHRYPHFLPDDDTILFVSIDADLADYDDATIAMVSLSSGEVTPLIEGGTRPVYSPTGHIVYARGGSLYAIPFDSGALRITGDPFRVLDDVMTMGHTAAAHFALAGDGTLVFATGGSVVPRYRILDVGLDGVERGLDLPDRYYANVRVSPDRRRLAMHIEGASSNLWVYDYERGTLDQVTSRWENEFPLWTPDGRELIYFSSRSNDTGLYRVAADGGSPPTALWIEQGLAIPESISSEGRLVFTTTGTDTGYDIWTMDVAAPGDARPLLAGQSVESEPALSPDGDRLAYVSDASGRLEVYLTSFPDLSGRWTISNAGGTDPIWSLDGRRLFYRQGTELMAVSIEPGNDPRPGVPERLTTLPAVPWLRMNIQWSLAPDGEGILVLKEVVRPAPTSLQVVTNVFEQLRAR